MNENFSSVLKENFNIDLNEQQLVAVSHKDGPAVILAVPGAGKTTVLICRTANLIMNHGVSPENILSITFSKASAKDMKERFSKVFGRYVNGNIRFSTIHSFAFSLINEYAKLNRISYKLLIDGNEPKYNKVSILKSIYHNVNGGYINDDKLEELLNTIGYIKNKMIDITDYGSYTIPQIKKFDVIYRKYEEYKKINNLIDFDDMLTMAYTILKDNPNILQKYRNKFKYIQVDEGQDTSRIQNKIVDLIAQPRNNVFVVADDDQSIYAFRGASPEDLLKFKERYPLAKTFFMEENYRSTRNIVSVCNSFIQRNINRYNKNLFTKNEKGKPVTIVKVSNEHDQYEYILKKLKECTDISNSAILYRNNISSIALAEKLSKSNIPFYIRDSKLHFFKHWVVNDIVSFIKLALDNSDVEAFENIYYKMKGYLSKASLNYVKNHGRSNTVFDNLLSYPEFRQFQLRNIMGLKKDFKRMSKKKPLDAIRFIENHLEYGIFLKEYCKKTSFSYDGAKTVLSHLKTIASECSSLLGYLVRLNELEVIIKNANVKRENSVVLTTIHSSKGLEFEKVFMLDLIDGEFPTISSVEASNFGDIEALEEERRLFYVGMTRAKNALEIISIKEKNGERVIPSRFIDELEYIMNYEESSTVEPKNWLRVGNVVVHVKFGKGRIISIDGDIIEINFNSVGNKQLSINLCIEKDILKAATN